MAKRRTCYLCRRRRLAVLTWLSTGYHHLCVFGCFAARYGERAAEAEQE